MKSMALAYLRNLQKITTQLRIIGITMFLFTFTHFGVVFVFWSNLFQIHPITARLFVFSILITSLFTVILALGFEMRRRDGNILFEEISNELHGMEATSPPPAAIDNELALVSDEHEISELRFHAKVVLRQFSYDSELPLVPGRFGPALISAINILLFFVLSSFLSHSSLG